jgi:hypothetical protein
MTFYLLRLMEMHLEKVLSKKTEEKKHFSWYLESH